MAQEGSCNPLLTGPALPLPPFGPRQGALDGGLSIPHIDKRFVGWTKEEGLDAEGALWTKAARREWVTGLGSACRSRVGPVLRQHVGSAALPAFLCGSERKAAAMTAATARVLRRVVSAPSPPVLAPATNTLHAFALYYSSPQVVKKHFRRPRGGVIEEDLDADSLEKKYKEGAQVGRKVSKGACGGSGAATAAQWPPSHMPVRSCSVRAHAEAF